MTAKVVSLLPRHQAPTPDWTQAEVAELYRIEHALIQSGLSVDVDRGLTDEGDPWFVFCRPDGEVLIHLTRYDGLYRLHSPALPSPLIGQSFRELTKAFARQIPLHITLHQDKNGPRLFVHPAAMLAVVIGTIFLASNELALYPQVSDKKDGNGSDGAPHNLKGLLQSTFQSYIESFFGWLRDSSLVQQSAYIGVISAIAAFLVGSDTTSVLDSHSAASTTHSAEGDAHDGHSTGLASNLDLAASQAQSAEHQASHKDVAAAPAQNTEGDGGKPTGIVHVASVDTAPNGPAAPNSAQTQNSTADNGADLGGAQATAHSLIATGTELAAGVVFGQGLGAANTQTAAHGELAALSSSPVSIATAGQVTVVSDLLYALSAAIQSGQNSSVGPAASGQTASLTGDVTNLFSHAIEVNVPGDTTNLVAYVLNSNHTDSSMVQASASIDQSARTFDASAASILLNFLQDNPNAQAVFNHNSVVVYDSISDTTPANVEVWKFADGSTIAIVGHADHGFVSA